MHTCKMALLLECQWYQRNVSMGRLDEVYSLAWLLHCDKCIRTSGVIVIVCANCSCGTIES